MTARRIIHHVLRTAREVFMASSRVPAGASRLAVLSVASVLLAHSAGAQITELTRSPVSEVARLTFGYLCDDTFLLRNDGTKEVNAELGVNKGTEHTRVALAAHEQVQFTSKSKEDVELWVDGKLVAKAEKDKRGCKDVQGNAAVAVAPLDVNTNEKEGRSRYTNYPFYDPWFYGMFGPGWGYGAYAGLGYRPYYTGFVGVPIIVGGRGGRRR
jgi:hypothetical protein